jgi:uncharacterized low-complexity protein
MSEKKMIKPVAIAVGAAIAGTFAISGAVNADTAENPFSMSTMNAGYMLGTGEGSHDGEKKGEGSCGEGSCGEKEGEGSCGEGSCGESHDGDKKGEGSCGEGSCGESHDGDKKGEGSCGEGSCGEKEGEGSCGSTT